MSTQERYDTFSALTDLVAEINRQRFTVESRVSRAAAEFVHDWLVEHGLDQVRVDDEHGNSPSYAMLEDGDESEELDHAVGWLPREVISNPTPPGDIYENGRLVGHTPPGWNPVVTVADLAKYLGAF